MPDLVDRYLKVRAGLKARDEDPLSYWRFAVPRLREALALFTADQPIDELHMRACNKGTKTETEAAFVLACAQKRPELDGVRIPRWRGRVEAAQLVLDYKQQILSVQPAYLRLLGSWPHRARYLGAALSSLHVMPVGGNDNESEWSVIHFLSEENKRTGLGVRADVVAFDEPPPIEILHEMRKAPHAGRPGIRIIAETPTIRSQWAPLKLEYGDCPRRTLRRATQDWAEVRWSLEDVADWVLSRQEKERLIRAYEKDPLREARIHGDYIDASGSNPFDVETLLKMLEYTEEPEILEWRITREAQDESGLVQVVETVPVEIYESPKRGASYYINIDPSSGTRDSRHDPGGLLVAVLGSGDLVARFNGWIGSYGLGVLGAGLARQYHDAVIDPETNGGWGEGVLRGLADSHYRNLSHERRYLLPGQDLRPEVGFETTTKSRPAMVSAIQAWIESWKAGIRYAKCPSQGVIQCLLDIVLDDKGKPVAAPGFHDEDMILWGQALRRCVTSTGLVIPELYREPKTTKQKLAAMIKGEYEEEDIEPMGGRIRVAKERPRP